MKDAANLHPEASTAEIRDLRPHPRNYRKHPEDQLAHIIESIKNNGFYRNVVIARDGTILAGHGVVEAAAKMGMETVPVIRLDLDPEEPRALKVLTGDNEISRLGEIDDRALSELLKDIMAMDVDIDMGVDVDIDVGGLLGTGYDEMMLANLAFVSRPETEIRDLDKAAEWVGLPEYDESGDKLFKVVVSFTSEEDRAEFVKKMGGEDATRCVKGPVWSFRYPLRDHTDDWESIRFDAEPDTGEA